MEQKYMKRAIALSKLGMGYTNPNPLVGAVIVKDGRIIGEGYHAYYGGPHAEINAFENAGEDVRGGVLYVTLEPCSHYGKTPPCAEAIVEKGISKVVIGMKDPNPLVAGKGIDILKDNEIEVITGVLEEEITKVNEIFIHYITTGTPFCILKTAMTLDGKIAAKTGDSKWITGEASRKYVHRLRHRVAAIMVGIGTVLEDDPWLTTRLDEKSGQDPVRVIVDTYARIPPEAKVCNVCSKAKTMIAVTEKADQYRIEALRLKGAEVLVTPVKDGKVDLAYLMKALGERGIDSILLEGGSALNYSALDKGIVNKIMAFIAPKIIGGTCAKTPVGGEGKSYVKDAFLLQDMTVRSFGRDMMIEGYVDV